MPTVSRSIPNKTHTQTVIFPKEYWTEESARKWIKDHDMFTDGLDETENSYRFRQYNPDDNQFRYKSKKIEDDKITLVIGYPKQKSINFGDYFKHLDPEIQKTIKEELDSDIEIDSLEIKRVTGTDFECEDEEIASSIGYASTRKLDFSGDLLQPEGIILSIYKKNPVVFYNHFTSAPPIGKAVNLEVDDFGLKTKIQYAVNENQEANTIYKLIRGGYIKQHSIGFVPVKSVKRGQKEFDGLNEKMKAKYSDYDGDANRIIQKALLLEISVVNIADNQSATIMDVKSLDENDIDVLKHYGINIEKHEVKVIKEPAERVIKLVQEPEPKVKLVKEPEKKQIKLIKEATRKGKILRG